MKTKTQEIFELSCPYDTESQGRARRILFVCSAGLLRSPTAAAVAVKLGYNARSCGSERYALVPISVNLINWAEAIYFVNEYNYLSAKLWFEDDMDTLVQLERKAVIWDLEDIYNYGDLALKNKIEALLN